ncbi:MAG: type II toxin-antitoxin system HicA family toxin [Oscillospiraceae bacterium]|nr:type II toxin-antitoxin system HicA family toxin [Oscillospiraceae bacterium]
MSGESDNNIKYSDFRNLIIGLGFKFRRQRGSHTMYYHNDIKEFVNIQKDGNKAKGYQVEHLRNIIVKYKL